jgi:predicted aldo/keto reductase-like oxidoreductase
MPINVMDAHYESFEKKVLPVALGKGMGVLSMKPMGGGFILDSKTVKPEECLRYALSAGSHVVITGCEKMGVLEQAINVAINFKEMTDAEKAEVLAKTKDAASKGEFEKFKTSDHFDGTAKNPHWLEEARI